MIQENETLTPALSHRMGEGVIARGCRTVSNGQWFVNASSDWLKFSLSSS